MKHPCLHCGTLTSEPNRYCCSACRVLADGPGLESPKRIINQFQPYSSPEVEELYNSSTNVNEKHYRLALQGLQCSSCVHLLEQLPSYVPDVLSARVNFPRSEIIVATTPSLALSQLLGFFQEMGYSGQPLQCAESADERLVQEDRDIVKRLAVAGACSGNIMLFAVPIYGGLAGDLAVTFNFISIALFLPILFYSAVPIYRSAWGALKFRHLNVDIPLVVALWSGFGASLINLFRGSEGIYLDSTAGFIFLILCSRWFLRVSQRRWLESPLSASPWKNDLVAVRDLNGHRYIPCNQLACGQVYGVRRDQVVPVDSVLESSVASFDTSWMTGESMPRIFHRQMPVPAGYRCVSETLELQAVSALDSSELAKSLRRIENQVKTESRKLNLFDRTARDLLLLVFLIGALLVIAGPQLGLSVSSAFERALSLLIVACPCALAFGGPLAYGMSLRRAAEQGVLVRNPDVLDRVTECQTIVFDKTGTLTDGNLQLIQHTPAEISEGVKNLILSLEKNSSHPVANAFRMAWQSHALRPIALQDVHEVPGKKICGIYEDHLFSLKATQNFESSSLVVGLFQDDRELANFVFDDVVRPETRAVLGSLQKNFSLHILSGDRDDRVQTLIRTLNIPGLVGHGDCSPQEKAEFVKRTGHCLMVGDGINDIEALASAHVGIAMNGAIEHGLLHGSGYFLKPGLNPLIALLKAASKAQQLTRANLTFALAYNLGAGAAAILGWVNPLTAAVLMPLSSGFILFGTWRASR